MHNPVFAQCLRVLGSAAFFSLVTSLLGLGVWLALNPVSCIWRSLFRRTSS